MAKPCEHIEMRRAKTGGWFCVAMGCNFEVPELPRNPPSSNERLARLRTLATSSIVGADLQWLLERYEQLRAVATPIADALRQVGDETDWRDGAETDRVYAWHEMEPLWKTLAGSPVETSRELAPSEAASFDKALARSPRRVESVLDFRVTVCSECLQASCWLGEFYCEQHREASTVVKTVRELHALGPLEDPGWWFKCADTGKVNYRFLEAYQSAVKSTCSEGDPK